MYAYGYQDLDREQLEDFVDLILSPLDHDHAHKPDRRYMLTDDPSTDELLEVAIKWLDSVIFAMELIDGRKEKANIFDLEKDPRSAWKNKQTHFNLPLLDELRSLLEDLRKCEQNRIIARSIHKQQGRPRDNHRIERLKNEVGRVYHHFRIKGANSKDACDAINSALKYLKMPLMSNDSIRKRASYNKASPTFLLDEEFSDEHHRNDSHQLNEGSTEPKITKEMQELLSIFLLQKIALDARNSL